MNNFMFSKAMASTSTAISVLLVSLVFFLSHFEHQYLKDSQEKRNVRLQINLFSLFDILIKDMGKQDLLK